MGTLGRRRRRLTLTALAAAAAPLAAPLAPVASASGHRLATVFSCGSRWTTARTCSDLCPAGDDASCPPGQHCHGGIRCEGGEPAMREARERHRLLEREEMDRILLRRREEYADEYVCGRSFEEAGESCAADSDSESSDRRGMISAASYCPSGSSDECPAGTRCFAAVPCPREEVPSGPLDHPPSVAESVPLDASATDRNDTTGRLSRDEERGSWPAVSSWGETFSAYARGAYASLDSLRYYGSH